jgi:hypothetical protein
MMTREELARRWANVKDAETRDRKRTPAAKARTLARKQARAQKLAR